MDSSQIVLIDEPQDEHRTPVNSNCFLSEIDGCMVVVVRGQPVFSFDANDVAAKRLAMVQLVEFGTARKADVAKAFDVQRITVYRHVERYRAGGVQALIPKKRGPKGPRVLGGRRDQVVLNRKQGGESMRDRLRTKFNDFKPQPKHAIPCCESSSQRISACWRANGAPRDWRPGRSGRPGTEPLIDGTQACRGRDRNHTVFR